MSRYLPVHYGRVHSQLAAEVQPQSLVQNSLVHRDEHKMTSLIRVTGEDNIYIYHSCIPWFCITMPLPCLGFGI